MWFNVAATILVASYVALVWDSLVRLRWRVESLECQVEQFGVFLGLSREPPIVMNDRLAYLAACGHRLETKPPALVSEETASAIAGAAILLP